MKNKWEADVSLQKHISFGLLIETNDGTYSFEYTEDYIKMYPKQFLTFTMPVINKKYIDRQLFPFFEGLIPEGWLLDIAWKLEIES